jgi:hypothetical protein
MLRTLEFLMLCDVCFLVALVVLPVLPAPKDQ